MDHKVCRSSVVGLGLLDTGATASMRQGTASELNRFPKRTVALAVGEAEMCVSDAGTLLTGEAVEPLVCVADLAAMGM